MTRPWFEALRPEGAAPGARLRRTRLAGRHARHADRQTVGEAGVRHLSGRLRGLRLGVVVHDLVAELQEAALLDVGVFVDQELRADVVAGVEGVGEVQPLEAAVFQQVPGVVRAADGLPEGARLRRAEGLVRVAVVGEGPVDAHGVGHHLAQARSWRCRASTLDVGERPLRIEEVVHVRREAERVGELVVHRVRRVQDHEDVRVRARVGLQELPVVRPRRGGDQERQKPGDAGPMPSREAVDAAGGGSIAHGNS